MVQTLAASNIDLRVLIDQIRLRRVQDNQFFAEWQENLPEITPVERQLLDKIKDGYVNLIDYVKLVHSRLSQFALSDQFGSLNQLNGLDHVFKILKRIGNLAVSI